MLALSVVFILRCDV